MPNDPLAWTVPMMRMGYAGRGLTYLVVAGFSLLAVSRGGRAEGTSTALSRLEGSTLGGLMLVLIFLGLLAYALWRALAALLDLDAHGSDAKGIAARLGMAASGAVHLGLGIAALTLLVSTGEGEGGGGGDSRLREAVGMVMAWPGGRWIVGLAGLVVIGAGAVYVGQGWTMSYERYLASSAFTTRWRTALRVGVAAHGVALAIVGLLSVLAAWRADPAEAGGLDGAFDWLSGQPYGRALVALLCLGLLAFAGFCLVNARCRVVPRVAGDATPVLAEAARRLVPGA